MSDKKTDISDLLYKAKTKKKYIAPVQEVKEEVVPPQPQAEPQQEKVERKKAAAKKPAPRVKDAYVSSGKMGRPTEKDFENVTYVKISARIPEETRDKMRIAMYSTLKGKFKTQDELINTAILRLIK